MKTSTSILSATGVIATILATSLSSVSAQSVDTSTGTVLDSADTPSGTLKNPAMKIIAAIRSTDETAKTRGILNFSGAGDGVNVSGRIEGLEPNKRYLLTIQPQGAPDANAVETPATREGTGGSNSSTEPSQAGKPEAGPPVAGAPIAGAPAAGTPVAGKPNGQSRPGAPGGGTQGTSVSGEKSLNTEGARADAPSASQPARKPESILADATGSANVSSTLRDPSLTKGAAGLARGMVMIHAAPVAGAEETGLEIASGKITSTPVHTEAPVEEQTVEDQEEP